MCLPLKTTAKAPCPIRSFLLNSNFPTVSMALRRGVPGAGGEAAAGTASELQRDEEEEEDGADEGAAFKKK